MEELSVLLRVSRMAHKIVAHGILQIIPSVPHPALPVCLPFRFKWKVGKMIKGVSVLMIPIVVMLIIITLLWPII
jgi:hypothetical protein